MKAVKLKDKQGNEIYWTQPYIRSMLQTWSTYAVAAMLRVYEYQTPTEKAAHMAAVINDMGFNGPDANILTSLCQWYQKCNKERPGIGVRCFSAKQLDIIKEKMPKYSKQIFNYMLFTYPENVVDVAKNMAVPGTTMTLNL